MAKNIDLKVRLKGDKKASKGLKNVDKSLKSLGKSALKASAAFVGAGALINSFRQATDAAVKQFMVEAKLASALNNVQSASKGGSKALFDYAKSLQAATTFGDENIISGMAMLATFQLNETQIKELTPRMLDMAAATNEAALSGGDLAPIALQLGKAFTGQASALTRSGVVIDQSALAMARAKGSTEEFNFILGELDKNFKGIAESIAKSGIGKLLQLKNQISDNKEVIGMQMIPVQEAWSGSMVGLSKLAAEMSVILKTLFTTSGSLAERFNAAKKAQDSLNESYQETITNLKVMEQQQLRNAKFLEEQELELLRKKIELQHEGLSIDEQILLAGNEIELNRVLAVEGIISENEMKKRNMQLTLQQITLEQQLKDAKLQAAGQLLGSLGSLVGQNKSNALIAARLAQSAAIIDTYAGASKAFAQGGTLGFLTAGSIIAAGLANVAQIESQMKEMQSAATGFDGVVTKPTMFLTGEKGPETVQVTPHTPGMNLNGPQGGVTINISGNMIGNEEFVRDTLIPEVERAGRNNLA